MSATPTPGHILEVRDIHTFIGEFHILEGVTVDGAAGQHHRAAGAQRRGQDDHAAQHHRPDAAPRGRDRVQGRADSRQVRAHKIAQMGIGYVPEKRVIFRDLTVGENLHIAEREKGDLERKADFIFGLFPDLKRLYSLSGGHLSGGQQQMLAIARALVPDNSLLLIDEPSEGLAPVLIEHMMEAIRQLSASTTVLLVEQNFQVASQLAERYVIIEEGISVHSGLMADLVQDKALITTYLGVA